MTVTTELLNRSGSACELCGDDSGLFAYIVPPRSGEAITEQVALCKTCLDGIANNLSEYKEHWRCLQDSIWNPTPAVQVTAYRILKSMENESWAQDLISTMYMDDETREWAEEEPHNSQSRIIHKDSNGNILEAGDTVTLIQDLNVKGANFTAKRGTAVRRIRLVHDNAEHIEGKIDGQQIVILTKFTKKSN
jgi:protein PhnA